MSTDITALRRPPSAEPGAQERTPRAMVAKAEAPHLQILGIRGLPPRHGGFETFAGRLAPYLAKAGWTVTVYCQRADSAPAPAQWQGVDLVHVDAGAGSRGSISFDLRAVRAASELPGPALVLGYNTAVLNEILRRRSKAFVVNMDGIEWRRRKWGAVAKTWFYLNEAIATRRSTHLIADHPDIQRHLERHRRSAPVTMIPYGADKVTAGDEHLLDRWALRPGRYATVIARPEPENSILEMVTAFSRRRRDRKLVVLGAYDVSNAYQHEVMSAASDEVLFPGPIYETELVEALRFHSAFYAYGHSVGGTSPTLVEALAAGSPPLCLDTVYSRWVAGSAGEYFRTIEECDQLMTALFEEEETSRSVRRERAYARHQEEFTWERILAGYQQLLQGLAE